VASWRRDTWQRGGLTRGCAWERVTAHRIFRRRVRARPVSNTAVFCAVESRILRSFQRYRRCLDRSPVTADLRVAVCPFGDEAASWQRDDRISDRRGAGDS
jgi:hypothetical protein